MILLLSKATVFLNHTESKTWDYAKSNRVNRTNRVIAFGSPEKFLVFLRNQTSNGLPNHGPVLKLNIDFEFEVRIWNALRVDAHTHEMSAPPEWNALRVDTHTHRNVR
jgi:hypothetical protein